MRSLLKITIDTPITAFVITLTIGVFAVLTAWILAQASEAILRGIKKINDHLNNRKNG